MTTDLATDSTTNYLKLRKAIDTAIQTFSKALNRSKDEKYGDILTELSGKIGEVRTEIDATLVVTGKKKSESEVKKSESKLGSKEMNLDDVKKFIDSKSDAIFVVTGGSFNPPHNGHIGMFQKAYAALIKEGKIKPDDGKKVYGVMVPATEGWLDKKVVENKLDASQKIDIKDRVDLCKLSCDSYAWPDSTNFNASNMIVVNEGDNSPATSILLRDGQYRDNAYYLCGSDYYAAHGSHVYKFICVLRAGVTLGSIRSQKQIHFDKPPITDHLLKSFDVKATDIIIKDDGDDNDASSTMLRNILTKINSVVIQGDEGGVPPDKDELLKLISIPVLRKLLELKYILTDTETNKKVLRIMGIDLDEEDYKAERAENMDKVGELIELNVDIGSDTRDEAATVTKKFNRIETGGGGDCLFHTLRYLLTTAGKFSPTGNKTADMMMIRNAIVDHVKKLGDGFKHLQVPIGDKLDFKKNNETLVKDHSGKSDSEIAKINIDVDGAVRIDGSRLLFADRVVTFKQDLRGDDKHMKYVSQDMTKNYFTVMKEQGTYGTEFELGIAAALYDIMLCVISDERRCQYYIFDKVKNEVRGNEPGEYERNKKNIWYIYNYTNTHYQYLECIDEPAENRK
jgi:nicotinic acid mononucleotide adenylyltransferase